MEIQKILTKYDSYLNMGKLKDAEALLLLSLQDAEEEGLYGARLTLLNELEGLYRTTGRARQAMEISEKALALISVLGLTGQEPHAVTLLNGATACRAAGENEKALQMYRRAEQIRDLLHHLIHRAGSAADRDHARIHPGEDSGSGQSRRKLLAARQPLLTILQLLLKIRIIVQRAYQLQAPLRVQAAGQRQRHTTGEATGCRALHHRPGHTNAVAQMVEERPPFLRARPHKNRQHNHDQDHREHHRIAA